MLLTRFPKAIWTPLSAGTPLLWLDATSGITLGTGSKVASWASRTGSIAVAQTSPFQPNYNATGWNSAKPTVEFGTRGGTGNYTQLRDASGAVSTLMANSKQFTAVCTFNLDLSSRQYIYNFGTAATILLGYGISDATGAELIDLHAGGADITGNTIGGNGNRRTIYQRTDASDNELTKIDGVTSINQTDGADPTTSDGLTLGGNHVLGTAKLLGAVSELIIWAGVLDVDAAYRAYSIAKWGA